MTVGIVVVSHSAALAAAAGELAAEMAGEQLRMALAGGIDDEDAPLGTDAGKVMQAIEEVDDEAGVVVLMDLGSAVLSAEMAKDLLPPETAARVVLCEAPIVEGLVAAAVQAAAGAPIEEVLAEARAGLSAKASHLGVEVGATTASAAVTPGAEAGEVRTATLVVPNALGFHARPAARIVEGLAGLEAQVELTDRTTGRGPVSARSMNALITLGARQGHELLLAATGSDAGVAVDRLLALAADNLGDPLGDESTPGRGDDTGGGVGSVVDGAITEGTADVVHPDAGVVHPDAGLVHGLPAAPGIAVGRVQRLGAVHLPTLDELLASAGAGATVPDDEHAALDAALGVAHERLERSRAELAARAGTAAAELVGTQALVLDDPALLEPTRVAIDSGETAASAWAAAVRSVLATYAEVEDPYLVERAGDLDAIGREVLAALVGHERVEVVPQGVVVARDLSPAETARLDPTRVDAIVTAAGSPTAHAALIARALGLAAVVGAGPAVLGLDDGAEVVVDGDAGVVETAPDSARIAAVREEVAARLRAHEELRAAAAEPALTRDGTRIEVRANVGLPRDAERAAAEGADGVGLLRSEFLFLDRSSAPDEEEQVATYTAICAAMGGRPVTLRTLDVGGDKPLDYIDLPREANPFLGTRGVRLGLSERVLLTTQLRAALRVAADHPLELMVPMVATLAEIAAVRALLTETLAALAAQGHAVPERPRLGVMVEIPALALKARHVVEVVDFVSIGTNDLTQYTLAAERGNPAVAELGDPLDPGVLALIAAVGDAATGTGTEVAVCGDLASDPAVATLLLGLGVTELSVPPMDVPAIKQAVRLVGLPDARRLAERALECASAAEVRALLR
ncbi:MAG: phosphoenolpyruvate--protein phosphotransferase [Nitriliruptoraceae bacterium]